MKKLAIFTIFLSILLITKATDIAKVKFYPITTDDGLSQSSVNVIFQDSKGIMWIGTDGGLNIYNGHDFKVFRTNLNDSTSINSNRIYSITEDSEGIIWIGTDIGLNTFNYNTNKISRISIEPLNPKGFHGGKVGAIEKDSDNTLWIASLNGIIHYLPSTKEFITYSKDSKLNNGVEHKLFFDLIIAETGIIYAVGNFDPIYEYNRNENTFSTIHYKESENNSNNNRKDISEDGLGNIIIGSIGNGLHIYNPKNETVKTLNKLSGLNSMAIVTSPLTISKTEVWIGTDGGGINIYNPINETFIYKTIGERASGNLRSNAITALNKDKDGNIWVGHFNKGISLYKKYKNKFSSYTNTPSDTNSINKETITSLFEDNQGRLWIGYDGGGLSLFNESKGIFTHFKHNPKDSTTLPTNVITAINQDENGNLLLGTYLQGMVEFNPTDKKVVNVFRKEDEKKVVSSNLVFNIFIDELGRKWISSIGGGVDVYHSDSNTVVHYTEAMENSIIPSNATFKIKKDKFGTIWFCGGNGAKGVKNWNEKTDTKKTYTINNGLLSNYVKDIVFINNYAWVTTDGGLNRIDTKTDSIIGFTMENNNLSTNSLMGILADNNNNLWISSTKGIIFFNTKTLKLINYTKEQGLANSEFKTNATYLLSDGRMVFGGTDGLTIFHPDSIKPSPIIPSLIFTSLKINNKIAIINGKDSPLKKNINETKKLIIKHKHRLFTIDFISIDYTSSKGIKYMYKLDGFDKDWVQIDNINFATYSNLKAGKYTFFVKGSNSDGVFNGETRSIIIKVKPPWYRAKLFVISVLILIIYLVVLYVKKREEQTKLDKEVLQKKINEAQIEIDKKIEEVEKQKEEIRKRDEQEKEMRFHNNGISKFSDIIAKNRNNVKNLLSVIISELSEYVNASVGAIYLVEKVDLESSVLIKTGDYCYSADQDNNKILPGEGYIGTCYKEKKTMEVNDLPDGYIQLSSGLGNISVSNIVIIPLINDTNCVGVIELGSINKMEEYKISMIEKLAESISSVITISIANEETQLMLEQNRSQSEELMAHEEELRQNLEEMQATQEESVRQIEKANELEKHLNMSKNLLDSLMNHIPDYIYFKDLKSRFIRVSKSMLPLFQGYSIETIIGKTDYDFHKKDTADKYLKEEQDIINSGNGIINETVIETTKSGVEQWVTTTKLPLLDSNEDIIGTFGLSKIITESKEYEQKFKELEKQLQQKETNLKALQIELQKLRK